MNMKHEAAVITPTMPVVCSRSPPSSSIWAEHSQTNVQYRQVGVGDHTDACRRQGFDDSDHRNRAQLLHGAESSAADAVAQVLFVDGG